MRLAVLNVGVQIGRADVVLPGLPLIGAGMSLLLPGLASGATLVLPEDYRTETLLSAIEQHRVTRAFVTPSTMTRAVLPEWQAPQRVQLFIELPRSPLNKILRREVRAALESDRGVLP